MGNNESDFVTFNFKCWRYFLLMGHVNVCYSLENISIVRATGAARARVDVERKNDGILMTCDGDFCARCYCECVNSLGHSATAMRVRSAVFGLKM